MAESLSCTVKQDGREYVVTVSEDTKSTTVTDGATRVTITPNSGNLNVRLPNGWGSWVGSMDQAVPRAIKLCVEAETQLTPEAAYQQMADYVKDCPSP